MSLACTGCVSPHPHIPAAGRKTTPTRIIIRLVSAASREAQLRSTPVRRRMADSLSFHHQQQQGGDVGFQQQKITIPNNQGEKLVGILFETGSKELVILCHGFQSSKENKPIASLAASLTREGISTFRFDFSGNGESEGSFEYGNYNKEAEDLHAVVQHFLGIKHEVSAIVGHSKGGNVVLLYASKYHYVPVVVNLSGRFDLKRGIAERLGGDFMERLKKDGFIDIKDGAGNARHRVTEESMMERLSTDMHAACLSIDEDCRVLTVHGSKDEVIPVEDAIEFSKLIPNHKLHIVEGANHGYNSHQDELFSIVLEFLRECFQSGKH